MRSSEDYFMTLLEPQEKIKLWLRLPQKYYYLIVKIQGYQEILESLDTKKILGLQYNKNKIENRERNTIETNSYKQYKIKWEIRKKTLKTEEDEEQETTKDNEITWPERTSKSIRRKEKFTKFGFSK